MMKDVYGVIGCPVEQSISPQLHNAIYEIKDEAAVYAAFRVEPENLGHAMEGVKALGIKGLNVTVPHKVDVMRYMGYFSREALDIGAVNTVLNDGGVLKGFNTDAFGLMDAVNDMGFDARGKRILILGAGGTAKSAGYGFMKAGAGVITYCNRTASKAEQLAKQYNEQFGMGMFDSLAFDEENVDKFNGIVQGYDFVINTTSAGMPPQAEAMPISEQVKFREGQFVYDVIYKPEKTLFLRKAEAEGCKIQNGLSMLLFQGIRAHNIWFGAEHDQEVQQLSKNEVSLVRNMAKL